MGILIMQQWEYLTIKLQGLQGKENKFLSTIPINWDADYFTQQLNYYGAQGWELVSCFDTIIPAGYASTTGSVFAMFKRKKEA